MDQEARWNRPTVARLAGSLLLSAALALCAAADSGGSPAGQSVELSARLDKVLASPALRSADVGVLVVRESDGQVLYERAPNRPLIPASNQKVLTSLAALDVFGPTHRFETLLYALAPPDSSGRIGELIVRGGGDPVLNSEDWMRLAIELRGLGIRRIAGDILLDDSAFDRERWHANWGATGSRAYHAPIGALTANYGHFVVTAQPGERVGDPVRVEISPPVAYLRLKNEGATGSGKSSLEVTRRAGAEAEIVTVQGTLRAGADPKVFYRSVLDPTLYAGAVLRWQLESNGIVVDGRLRTGSVPNGAVELHRFEGRQVAEITRLFMKFSNNLVAEMLVKAMGASARGGVGSWSSGLPVMRRALIGQGLDLSQVQLVDGSGLSRDNKLSARVLVDALRGARASFRFGPEFISSLPIAAFDGTLERRTRDSAGLVRGKSGLLTSVTSLAGYVVLGNGEAGVFSILVNGYKVSGGEAMAAVDRFVSELTRVPAVAAR